MKALLQSALDAMDEVYADTFDGRALTEAIRAHLAKPAAAPAWKDVPDVPGLWLCNLDLQAYHLPDPEIDLGGGNSWFGPIPQEPEDKS